MCGIAGLYRFKGRTTPEDISTVKGMMDAQLHRGPDGEGIFRNSHLVFGHRRLAIIDPSEAGKQPMSNEDGTVWVTYNGEIYNFEELRDDLINFGHSFRSKSDTEVLVHGYEEWGIEDLLGRLRGMFAFALYDSRSVVSGPRLVLAKDRFGIKPLYYHRGREFLVFGSEVHSLIGTGLVPNESNMEALVRFLQLGSVPLPLTTQKHISALPSGHYLTVTSSASQLKRYWGIHTYLGNDQPLNRGFPDKEKQIKALLEESVKLHLISDVPLGIFLSGGIDSSALVAMASRFREKSLTTLSIVFNEVEFNEAKYARIIAKKFATDHREVTLNADDLIEELPKIFKAMDQPTVDGINTYFVSKAAKQAGLTVVLSGIGGDEVFLGYDHFRKANSWGGILRQFARLPGGIKTPLINLCLFTGKLSTKKGLDKLTYLKNQSDEGIYLLSRGLFSQRQIQDLLNISEKDFSGLGSLAEKFGGQGWGIANRKRPTSLCDSLNVYEFQFYLQNQLLKDADFMSMAHSIETRVPFLDHRLVELLGKIPPGEKLDRKTNKPLLVKSLGNDLPREIWDRPKKGFTFPLSPWMKKTGGILGEISEGNRNFDSKISKKIWQDFKKDRVHWSRPWALMVSNHFL